MNEPETAPVLVQVEALEAGREIAFGANLAEQLGDRLDDIRRAIRSGTKAVADSVGDLPDARGWRLGEVSASFGVTLTAEAGVILSKASAGATFEVTVKYERAE
jgi:hypothetical protein